MYTVNVHGVKELMGSAKAAGSNSGQRGLRRNNGRWEYEERSQMEAMDSM